MVEALGIVMQPNFEDPNLKSEAAVLEHHTVANLQLSSKY